MGQAVQGEFLRGPQERRAVLHLGDVPDGVCAEQGREGNCGILRMGVGAGLKA